MIKVVGINRILFFKSWQAQFFFYIIRDKRVLRFSRRKIPFEYINVLQDANALERMLEHSKGRRQIPVIVDAGKVTIGFGGS